MAAVIAAMGWLRDRLPSSVIGLMAILAFGIFAFGYRQFVLANRISRFNPAKAKQFDQQLVDFSRDAYRAIADWEQGNPRPIQNHSDPRVEWQADRDRNYRRSLVFQERYMSQAVAHIVTLHGLGVVPPFSVSAGASSRPEGLISYLGAVGHLLGSGFLEEARAMNDERQQAGALPFALLR